MLNIMRYDSPLGRLLLAERDGALAGLWLEGQKYDRGSLREEILSREAFPGAERKELPEGGILLQTKDWLDRYFAGERPKIGELALAPEGSEFRREVWRLLCEIPYGEVTTYGEIGRKIAARRGIGRMSAQAVGGAVGHNPISIIIPCHRVVGADGRLTGYAGGLEKKRWLLTLEGVALPSGPA